MNNKSSFNGVLYHGTPYSFKRFSHTKKGTNTNRSAEEVMFHFTNDKETAIRYSRLAERETAERAKLFFGNYPKGFTHFEPQLITVKLQIKNPYRVINQEITKELISDVRKKGYDSIIVSNAKGEDYEFAVFKTNQISIKNIKSLFSLEALKKANKSKSK